ncbi:hypothetical protein EV383_4246 [Pseudonocardia sediminis]|uniref:Alpha/beta hydrolase family protein n=1 Tax=Pseudonocardia sediminis TaxID=1397368 RepID=A0A4Q7V1L8_PSEST|nr:hypothetical protein [Pseudonocardia sediminis]RZT87328.1 hypothetical protein EV383_4246 [Pseudonocardia sediminis]
MKVTSFNFMPYRNLPDDFDTRYPSGWVDAPWWELGDSEQAGEYDNQSIDELMYAAKMGFDGLGTNEHHQNVYGFMCNPNLFGAILAKMTKDAGYGHTALVQLGATVASTSTSRPSRSGSSSRCRATRRSWPSRWPTASGRWGTTGKFVRPIPDRGGAEDKLISPVCAPDFAAAIQADTRVEIVQGAGHVPQWEQLDLVRPLVLDHLKG